MKFADDMTIAGFITGENEAAYRDKVLCLEEWCSVNNFTLNTANTKELILDFRKKQVAAAPLFINCV